MLAISIEINCTSNDNSQMHEEQLEKQVLLCKGQHIMFTMNIWIEARLINGTLGEVIDIVYAYIFTICPHVCCIF